MATIRQKRLARNITESLNKKEKVLIRELLVSSGYAELSAEQSPKRIIESKGVKKELEILGFDEKTAKSVVSEILLNKRQSGLVRLNAADKVFKVLGTYAPEKQIQLQARVQINPKLDEIAREYEERIKQELDEM